VTVAAECNPYQPTDSFCQLRLIVEDTGIGIPPNQQQQIFEPFFQIEGQAIDKQHGNGLGLTISLSLIELLGGNLNLSSILGQGSRFEIDLPRVEIAKGNATPFSTIIDINDPLLPTLPPLNPAPKTDPAPLHPSCCDGISEIVLPAALRSQLEAYEFDQWQQLSQAMTTHDIRDFIQQVRQRAEEYHCIESI
jgi:hypothetical protein